jgi:hypothetical protein
MRRILDRHQPLLAAHGIEVLAEKQSFLLELMGYHRQLLNDRNALTRQLREVEAEIAAIRQRQAPSIEPLIEQRRERE